VQLVLEPHVGDRVSLTRSGHSAGSAELGTIVAVLGETLRVRWSEHLETFVPAHVISQAAPPEASRTARRPATRHASRTPGA
jgi:hypothetical protein